MAADLSGCIEASAGYYGFFRFTTGSIGISFDSTGGTDERIYGKDSTSATDITRAKFHLEYLQLSCSSGPIALLDGSEDGTTIAPLACGTDSANSGTWDFRDDPLVCLAAENTQSLCISSPDAGHMGGFIKGYWG